ncbi:MULTISPECIES: hypothetical protein [unclassified Streptomyces]|uniref:hypothetical protein n=1 Tax=unclassified Streptomyces TaxID=2593676 RepID=UPI00278BD094|nr:MULTISPECIES: hypothetical protein [unclassified Streptomyces]
MPNLSTLIDTFNDGGIGPDWGNAYGGVTETGGRARVPCTTAYAGYQTANSWTLTDGGFYVAIVTLPAAAGATEAYASVFVNAPGIEETGGPLYGCRIGFAINTVSGQLLFKSDTGYTDPDAVAVTYSATDHRFLRLSEAAGTVSWDTSPDGTTWTNRRTLATPAWVTASTDQCALDLSAHRDAGTADFAEYDSFNTLSDAAVFTGSASGSAQSNATATGALTALGTATGAAQSGATATGIPIFHGAGSGSAHTDATVVAASSQIPEVADMAAGDWDLYIEQGASFLQRFTVANDPDFTWAGWSARAQIRTSAYASGELILDLTPFLTVDGATIRLAIPASVTQTLTRDGRWDLEVVLGSTVVRLLQGKAMISLEVTR